MVEKIDTVRHLLRQPSWVQKQILGDPLADLAATRVSDSILPAPVYVPARRDVTRPMSHVSVRSIPSLFSPKQLA